ncbi:MAG: NAD(P)-binding protein, partial [Xanthomonadales bacterium]|nr:NAD(P)-binding protein [Xanthomonadales bacterium]
DTMALINGRELYGYPKYDCEYTMPQPGDQPPYSFSLSAKGFQPFAPDTELAMHPLFDVAGAGNGKADRELSGWEHLVGEMLALLKSLPGFWEFDEAAWQQLVDLLKSPQIDQIFLKQLPDGSGQQAVYQAIVTAPAVVEKIHSVKLLGDDFQLNLQAFDSFPLDRSLGWKIGSQKAILPFAINFDFRVVEGQELVDNSRVEKERIAVLGGGVGAMTAAFWLSNQPGWQNRYEIDVYQMGWRLGGKGASGRNAKLGQRIEEHGLHIWFGFYDNGFDLMQQAYGELGRPPGAPLATWDEAFKPHHFISLAEDIRGEWKLWPIDTPIIPGVPGSGNERLGLWAALRTLLAWLRQWTTSLQNDQRLQTPPMLPVTPPRGSWLHRLADKVDGDADHLAADVDHTLHALAQWVETLPEHSRDHDPADHQLLADIVLGIGDWSEARFADASSLPDDLRRLYICCDLAVTTIKGMLADGVLRNGFEAINDIDFYAWLTKHGANPDVTVHSAPVRGFYDLVFAYEDGDFSRPNIEAGTMLRGMMKVAMCYHGGIMWKMQAGMGDVVFTPLYEVLKRRGVRFHFFNKVLDLQSDATAGERNVDGIVIQQQVALAGADYDPLVTVDGLDCWPSEPLFAQIDPEQAQLLQEHGINLESNWSNWPQVYEQAHGQPLPTRTLRRGVDFDKVVFGLSVASLPDVASQLLAQSPALAACSAKVKAVATQAYQVWMDRDIESLGWSLFGRDQQEPVLSAFTEPFDTWAPMDQLLCREQWPAPLDPKNASYFCSALPVADYPPYDQHGFPADCAARVKQGAINQLQTEIGALWPTAATPSFHWEWMTDPDNGAGVERFDRQYWRANVDPSERYVMSVVNSTKYRLTAEQSGFANLFLAGDWLKTGLDAGCVEAAVMGGMQASRAISGWPVKIHGEEGF